MVENLQTEDDRTKEGSTFAQRPEKRHSRPKDKGKFFVLRNLLNTIFIIGAIIGMIVYFFFNSEKGMIIILGAMAFKMCECVIRLVK